MSQYTVNGKKLLVTGAAGFIGACVVEQLTQQGATVVGIDNLNDYYAPSLKRLRLESLWPSESFEFNHLDVEDFSSLEKLFDRHAFDAVLNLAARAGVRASVENPFVYLTTNSNGSLNLLELMRRHGVQKFVLASTSSLYAGLTGPFIETAEANTPISPYAASKKSAEVMAYTYHDLFDIDVSVVRYFTVYGPAGRPDMSPYRFINWVAEGKPIQLFGDGTQSRDFTYVDDIAAGTIAALRPVGYEIFNLGFGRPHTLLEMIELIEQLVGREAKISFLPRQSTDMDSTWANVDKARSLLDWQAHVPLAEGLKRTWKWHESHMHNLVEGN